jgi:hypothetical protein
MLSAEIAKVAPADSSVALTTHAVEQRLELGDRDAREEARELVAELVLIHPIALAALKCLLHLRGTDCDAIAAHAAAPLEIRSQHAHNRLHPFQALSRTSTSGRIRDTSSNWRRRHGRLRD